MSDTSLVIQPRSIGLNAAAEALGVCRATLYRMYDDGEIEFKKLRGRTVVPVSEIDRLTHVERDPVGVPVGEPKPRRIKKIKLFPKVA